VGQDSTTAEEQRRQKAKFSLKRKTKPLPWEKSRHGWVLDELFGRSTKTLPALLKKTVELLAFGVENGAGLREKKSFLRF
jgi:hypothetical protein